MEGTCSLKKTAGNEYRILVRKCQGKRSSLRRCMSVREGIIEMNLRETVL
jgi:hypothetical protein